VLLHQSNEVRRSVASKCRLREVRIRRKKIIRIRVNVSEIATSAAGDQNLLADAIGPLEHQHAPSALARFDGAHQAGSARSKNDNVVF